MTVTLGASVTLLPMGTDALAHCFGNERAVGPLGESFVLVIPCLFGWAFNDGHGMGFNAEAYGTRGEQLAWVCSLTSLKGSVMFVADV
jgi:hypothetical protein